MINRRLIRTCKIGIALFIILLITLVVVLSTKSVRASEPNYSKVYTSVQIQDGDSLWDISDRNCVKGRSTEEYMNDICEINGINNTSYIKAGSYLTIYYYK